LKAIVKSLVTTYLKIAEETLDCLIKRYAMSTQLIRVKVVFEIGWSEFAPLYHRRILSPD